MIYMSLTAGIVGLPNVGKSTLFNAITKKSILMANYPFATIDPNVGVVIVPDERIDVLKNMYNPERVIPTTYEFTDIAGLVMEKDFVISFYHILEKLMLLLK